MMVVNENSTAYLSVDFLDKAGAAVVPSSVTYSLKCATNGTTLRTDVDVTADSSIEILLTPADNAIINRMKAQETRLVTVTAVYGPDDASSEQFEYRVRNLAGV